MVKKKEKKTSFLKLAFLLSSIVVALVLVGVGPRLLPRAAPTVDVSGEYKVMVNFTSPQVAETQLKASLKQGAGGKVTGTVSQPDGANATSIVGQVEGSLFTSEEVKVTTKMVLPEDESETLVTAKMKFRGAFDGNQIVGQVSGQVIEPDLGPLSGTFLAERTSTPPSPTPLRLTSTPLPQPTVFSPTVKPSSPSKFDINNDGTVNGLDFALALKSYGKRGAALACDVNTDRICNSLDLLLILFNFKAE